MSTSLKATTLIYAIALAFLIIPAATAIQTNTTIETMTINNLYRRLTGGNLGGSGGVKSQ